MERHAAEGQGFLVLAHTPGVGKGHNTVAGLQAVSWRMEGGAPIPDGPDLVLLRRLSALVAALELDAE